MRIRIRFSLQSDAQSRVRNGVIEPRLTAAGFVQRGRTGTWQADGITWNAAQQVISQVFAGLTDSGAGCIDHVWMYAENDTASPTADDDDDS